MQNKTITSRLHLETRQKNVDQMELQNIIKRLADEIKKLRNSLAENELELRKSRFEIGQLVLKDSRAMEAQKISQSEHRAVINEYKTKLDLVSSANNDKQAFVSKELAKMIKLIAGIQQTISSDSESVSVSYSRTAKHMIEALGRDLRNLQSTFGEQAVAAAGRGSSAERNTYEDYSSGYSQVSLFDWCPFRSHR